MVNNSLYLIYALLSRIPLCRNYALFGGALLAKIWWEGARKHFIRPGENASYIMSKVILWTLPYRIINPRQCWNAKMAISQNHARYRKDYLVQWQDWVALNWRAIASIYVSNIFFFFCCVSYTRWFVLLSIVTIDDNIFVVWQQ